MIGVIFIAKPSFLFTPPPLDPDDPLDNVTPQQRTSAVLVALMGVCGAAGAYLIIRVIGKRASAMHSIQYFSTYSGKLRLLIIFTTPAEVQVLFFNKSLYLACIQSSSTLLRSFTSPPNSSSSSFRSESWDSSPKSYSRTVYSGNEQVAEPSQSVRSSLIRLSRRASTDSSIWS